MFRKLLFSLLGISTIFLLQNKAFAGGGPIEFSLEPNTSLNPGEQYIVHARVWANGPYPTYCKNCYIKLALQNPQESDYIVQNSDRTNDDGRIYAKVISKIPGYRTLYASELIDSNGNKIIANSSVFLRYTGETSLPTVSISSTPIAQNLYLSLDSQKYIDGPKREIYLSWNKIENAPKYNAYVRQDGVIYEGAVLSTSSTYATVGINAFYDYYAQVKACTEPTNCIKSNEIFIKKMSPQNQKANPIKEYKETNVNIQNTEKINNQEVKELNQKVNELEKKLEESEKRQNILDAKIEDLLSWIKTHFPFFN